MRLYDYVHDMLYYAYDILDILIVSYVVYKILFLLRGTRAVLLLRGIFVVIFIWVISGYLHLTTLRWLIENFSSVGIIAVMIIFQPELRRALEQIGRGGFFRKFGQLDSSLSTLISSEIVRGVGNLVEDRIGALIVLERETGLADYFETGVEIEAILSAEILQSIFVSGSLLHDGAVIIQRDIVKAAGCFLPLSENPYISKNLGTRHRAGIGITEISDAIAIIVSEETGGISIAIRGKLERGLSEEELISRLFEELHPTRKSDHLRGRRNREDVDE